MNKKSLIFFGNESFSSSREYNDCPIFSKLVESDWEIETLLIKKNENKSRLKKDYKIIEVANRNKIPVKITNTTSDLVETLDRGKISINSGRFSSFWLNYSKVSFSSIS